MLPKLGIVDDTVGTTEDSHLRPPPLVLEEWRGSSAPEPSWEWSKSKHEKTAPDKKEDPVSEPKQHCHSHQQDEEMLYGRQVF